MNNTEVYETITASVLTALENGTAPWRKPWTVDLPTSLATGKAYRGVNVFLLDLAGRAAGYTSNVWGTYKAIKEHGGQVRKGEKSTLVVFWRIVKGKAKGDEEAHSYPMMRYYRVFNAEQADGLELPTAEATEHEPQAEAEAVLKGYFTRDDAPELVMGGNRACYSPSRDVISLPHRDRFADLNDFYGTAYHECAHSTGHESRLNRPDLMEAHFFGDESYAKEELVAEMTAAMVAGATGIETTLEQSASYIAGWLRSLRNDHKLVVQAAGQAQRAADLILGTTFTDKNEEEN
jgi:antirestriction protein ArdC